MFFLIFIKLESQERPTIGVFTPKDYGAESQNWSISQAKNKYIYVANNKGLLEFNGSEWQLYKSPNETIIRSVNVINNIIYTGCNREFGYWAAKRAPTPVCGGVPTSLRSGVPG